MLQLSATRCSCIAILWVSLVSFVTITLCVASQRVFVVVRVYFVMTQSGNFWIHSRISSYFWFSVAAGHSNVTHMNVKLHVSLPAFLWTYNSFDLQLIILTYLRTYLLTYLLTYSIEQEYSLKSWQLLSLSKNSLLFMAPEGSLPCSRNPATGPYLGNDYRGQTVEPFYIYSTSSTEMLRFTCRQKVERNNRFHVIRSGARGHYWTKINIMFS
jgi:hypothetical protein